MLRLIIDDDAVLAMVTKVTITYAAIGLVIGFALSAFALRKEIKEWIKNRRK